MNRIIKLTLIFAMCMCGVAGAQTQNYNKIMKAPKPKVDAKGYFYLKNCPRSIPNVKVTADLDDLGQYVVKVYIKGNLIDTFKCMSTNGEVRFVDANFDGYYDFIVGPVESRNYSQLYLWDSKKQWFYHAVATDDLNGYLLLNPAKKQWVSRGSSSYCSNRF